MSHERDNSNTGGLDGAALHELHQLCTRLSDEVITDEETKRLDQLLNENSEARQIYLRHVALHNVLMTSTGKYHHIEAESLRRHITEKMQSEGDSFDATLPEKLRAEEEPTGKGSRRNRLLAWGVAATLVVSATFSVYWVAQAPSNKYVAATKDDQVEPGSAGASEADIPATAVRFSYVSPSIHWTHHNDAFMHGSVVQAGSVLTLSEGEIELTYDTGTKLLLIGPAEFLVEPTGGKLHRGGLVASVTKAGHGFTIETPNGKIVDLGTEFGVAVDDFGVSEVSVFQGRVEAFPVGRRGQGKRVELTKGSGLQWNQDDLIPLEADLRRFALSVLDLTPGSAPVDGGVSLVDRFRSASLDTQKWKTKGNVQTSVDGLILLGDDDASKKPYLISAEQFDPAQGPVTVTCDFHFAEVAPGDPTSFSILTRSSNTRGVALTPWEGTLASCARCCFSSHVDSGGGILQTGVKLESNRELSDVSWSGFLSPSAGTPYRVVMRDDGVNLTFTISLRDEPSTIKTVTCRSLFRGEGNFVAFEGAGRGTTVIERVEVSQDISTLPLSSYADFSSLLMNGPRQKKIERQLLASLAPETAEPVCLDHFEAGPLDVAQWNYLGDVQVKSGAVQLGLPNDEGHIDTWKARPYLLTRKTFDPSQGDLTITGKITFADNFLAGYGASFSVMTRANDVRGTGPGWENSVLQRGVRANYWPAAWDSDHSLEIHEKPTRNTITLLATRGLQVDPNVRTYLFRVVDNGELVTLTIIDPKKPNEVNTISAPVTSSKNEGFVGFESCWGSPITLDDVSIYQDLSTVSNFQNTSQ